jgi:RHS repeat-associated protein
LLTFGRILVGKLYLLCHHWRNSLNKFLAGDFVPYQNTITAGVIMNLNFLTPIIVTGTLLFSPILQSAGGLEPGSGAPAEEVKDYGYNFHEQNNITPDIPTLTTDLFGDKIDPSSGSVAFEQTDLVIPGNSGLSVGITRTLSDPDSWFRETREFENWSLSIPHVRSTYITDRSGNAKNAYWAVGEACTRRLNSNPNFSNYVSYGPNSLDTQAYAGAKDSYWNGDTVSIPGYGTTKFTEKAGDPTYKRYNSRNWDVTCITNADGTQGFKITLDNGVTYIMGKQRTVESIKPFNLSPSFGLTQCNGTTRPCPIEAVGPSDPDETVQYPQFFVFMQATKVEDRFGNWVDYSYHSDGRLKNITSNDGRTIDIYYSGSRVSSITANGKTWNYSYNDYRVKTLERVTRPDGKAWIFDHDKDSNNSLWIYGNIAQHAQAPHHGIQCIESGTRDFIAITHPEGMQGSFVLDEVCQGQSNVPKIRRPNPLRRNYDTYFIPNASNLFAISTKTLTMTSGESYVWNYDYSDNTGHFRGDTITSANRTGISVPGFEAAHLKSTTTTNPDNSKVIQYFDRRYGKTSGNLLFTEIYNEYNALKMRNSYSYADGYYHGLPLTYVSIDATEDNYTEVDIRKGESASRKQNLTNKVELFLDTLDSYTTNYSGFDIYDNPLKTYEYNNFNGKKRYVKNYYHHDLENNILSLPSRTEVSSNDATYTEVAKTTYHSSTGSYKSLPSYHYEYGRWYKRNESYHTSGDQAGLPKLVRYNGASYNSNSRWVEFSAYKRGKPQTIRSPQSLSTASQYAYLVVNDEGMTTSVKDFEGHCTSYYYDAINRPRIILPCDKAWTSTDITYATTTGSEGLNYVTSGMLKQTITRGNYQKIIYHDNLLRPVLVKEWDKTNSTTVRYTRTDYDAFSRPTYQSKPSSSSTTSYGTSYSYDALGRTLEVDDNTTSGSIAYSYLSNNQVMVNDNKGNSTTTTYLAYGSPSRNSASYIASPHNVNTSLNYNIFGNVTSITQGGITESRVYDNYQKLCKTVRPDVGNSALVIDALNQITWSARGSSISSDTVSCDTAVTAADKISYSYDNLGNVRTEIFTDGSPNKTYTYDKNSRVKSLVAGNVTTNYEYNSAALIEKETLLVDSLFLALDYEYDGNGSLSYLTYPSGKKLAYSPNALGQPTKVVDVYNRLYAYATDAAYHPNGALKSHHYANGFDYYQSLYSSGLPSTTYDKRVSSDSGGGTKGLGESNISLISCTESSSAKTSTSVQVSKVILPLAGPTPLPGPDPIPCPPPPPPVPVTTYAINHGFTYDANNNLTFWDDKYSNAYDFQASYDGLDRLDVILDSYSGTGNVDYDSMGNITYYKIGAKTLNYVYNSSTKRLTSTNGYKSKNFQYDAKGNITHNGTHSFTYNTAGQMITSNAGSYRYDGNGKRVKTVDGQGTSYSMYASNGQLMYRKVNGVHTDYYYLGKKMVARQKGSVITYIHTDYLGSPAAESNAAGTVTARLHYQPFGESIEAPRDEVGYTGHKFDTELGLNYMQARYYDPVVGRFYSDDPVGFRDVHSFNRYTYANNNPYKYSDPDGETPVHVVAAGVGAVFGFVSSVAVQSFTGDGEINWGTVAAATAGGALVGLTAGLAAPEVAALGFTGVEATIAIGLQTAPVAAATGAATQVVDNLQNGEPMEKGVITASAISAGATVVGGVLGDKATTAIKESKYFGAPGKLVGGKATAEIIGGTMQEGLGQAASNTCLSEDCE